jgi:hypothetical protein
MEDVGEIEQQGPTLWGAHINQSKPVPLSSGERRLTVFRATLEKGNHAQIFITIKGEKYALGTLTKDKKDTFSLDLEIYEGSEEEYQLSVEGDGTVAVVGSYSPDLYGDEDDLSSLSDEDMLSNDEESDELEVPSKFTHKPAGPAKGQPAPKPAVAKPPQAKPVAAKPPPAKPAPAKPPATKAAAQKTSPAKPAAQKADEAKPVAAKAAEPEAKADEGAAKPAATTPPTGKNQPKGQPNKGAAKPATTPTGKNQPKKQQQPTPPKPAEASEDKSEGSKTPAKAAEPEAMDVDTEKSATAVITPEKISAEISTGGKITAEISTAGNITAEITVPETKGKPAPKKVTPAKKGGNAGAKANAPKPAAAAGNKPANAGKQTPPQKKISWWNSSS